MEIGAVAGIGAEDADELYETKASWRGHSIQKSQPNDEFPFEGKIFSHARNEAPFSKKCAALRPLMGKVPEYDLRAKSDVKFDQNGDPYGSFEITVRISSREDRTESRDRDRDRYYDHNESRRDSERNNEVSNSRDRD